MGYCINLLDLINELLKFTFPVQIISIKINHNCTNALFYPTKYQYEFRVIKGNPASAPNKYEELDKHYVQIDRLDFDKCNFYVNVYNHHPTESDICVLDLTPISLYHLINEYKRDNLLYSYSKTQNGVRNLLENTNQNGLYYFLKDYFRFNYRISFDLQRIKFYIYNSKTDRTIVDSSKIDKIETGFNSMLLIDLLKVFKKYGRFYSFNQIDFKEINYGVNNISFNIKDGKMTNGTIKAKKARINIHVMIFDIEYSKSTGNISVIYIKTIPDIPIKREINTLEDFLSICNRRTFKCQVNDENCSSDKDIKDCFIDELNFTNSLVIKLIDDQGGMIV